MLKNEDLILEKNIIKQGQDGKPISAVYLPPFYYAEAVVPQIVKLVQQKLPNYYHVDPSQIQVLTLCQFS